MQYYEVKQCLDLHVKLNESLIVVVSTNNVTVLVCNAQQRPLAGFIKLEV